MSSSDREELVPGLILSAIGILIKPVSDPDDYDDVDYNIVDHDEGGAPKFYLDNLDLERLSSEFLNAKNLNPRSLDLMGRFYRFYGPTPAHYKSYQQSKHQAKDPTDHRYDFVV